MNTDNPASMQKVFTGTIAIFLHIAIPASVQATADLSTPQFKHPIYVGVSDVALNDVAVSDTASKITFDFSYVSPDGLVGSPDGLRSISYEFCIPADAQHLAEVQSIDPTVAHFAHSRGRIGCRRDQYLCIGGRTHDARWRETLLSIARLEYVDRIDQFFGE